jgi:hypothetical protein
MILELFLSIVLSGQCDYVPPIVPEHQILCNHGTVFSKFYIPVRFPGGYRTSIPVVNGILPEIKGNFGTSVRLVLDYSRGRLYNTRDYQRGFINYEDTDLKDSECLKRLNVLERKVDILIKNKHSSSLEIDKSKRLIEMLEKTKNVATYDSSKQLNYKIDQTYGVISINSHTDRNDSLIENWMRPNTPFIEFLPGEIQ